MRYGSLLLAVLLALGASTGQSRGQEYGPVHTPRSIQLGGAHPFNGGYPFAADVPGAFSLKRRLLSGLAAGVLGAGLGFFASQLSTGDWDEDGRNGEIDRSTWAAVGGAGGFIVGFSIPLWGRAPGRTGPLPFDEDRYVISGEDIRRESLSNALEAVNFFHPEWLVLRGQEAIYNPEADNLRVYLDNALLGGVANLAAISPLMIESIRFFDARQATNRWGTGHTHGAIQVISRN